jgi:DNA-directed RNA polymerase subunit RPC12/RpoP
MSLRDFKCSNCTNEFSWDIPITKESPKTCPTCNQETLEFLVGPFIGFMADPKTVGSQAEKNSRNMGLYGRQEEIHRMKTEREAALRKRMESGLIEGETLREKPTERPWWRDTDKVDKSLADLKGDKLDKFLHTGVKT